MSSEKRAKVEEEEDVPPMATTTTTTTAVQADSDSEDAEAELIQEEHRIWKKNAPYLYDVCLIHKSPHNGYLTCDWLPSKTEHESFSSQEILLGTKANLAAENTNNYLSVMKVLLPPDEMQAAQHFNEEKNELANYANQLSKITPICQMIHDGDVERARLMPNNPFVIATRMGKKVALFKFDSVPSEPKRGETQAAPTMVGLGHTEEGYALDWNTRNPSRLLSGGKDGAFIWNAELGSGSAEMQLLAHFPAPCSDLAWDPHADDRFATVSLERAMANIAIWDARVGGSSAATTTTTAPTPALTLHSKDEELNAIAFNPDKPHLFLTAGSSRIVKLWDERNPKQPVHEFVGHTDEVYGLAWAQFNPNVFASGGGDRRVVIWDASRIGQEQSEEEKEDGPPEMVFMHGGHCGPVMDLAWNPNEDWMIASVSDDGDCGDLQIWRPAEHCITGDEDDENDDDDEGENGKEEDLE